MPDSARDARTGKVLLVFFVLLLAATSPVRGRQARIVEALRDALGKVWRPAEETSEDAEELIRLVQSKWAKPRGVTLEEPLKRFLRQIVIHAKYEANSSETEETPIPGDLITWLVGDPEASALLPSTGFKIENAAISGNLDQPIPRVVLPLYIVGCRFKELAHISGHFGNLSLRGTAFCSGLKVDETLVAGSLDLRELRCVGSLTMRSTWVSMNLLLSTCDLGEWQNCRREWHVDLQGLEVGGDLNMSGLIIEAPSDLAGGDLVNLRDVTVRGSLIARSVELAGVCGYAFHAKHLRVSGDVLLDEGLEARGGIAICDSTLDGSLLIDEATLTRLDRPCLRLSDTRIGQSLFMRGITATGEVNLAGAVIGGEILIERSTMRGNPALVLADAHIGSSIVFGPGFLATGEVNLDGVSVAGSVSLAGGEFKNSRGIAVSMNHASIHADLRLGGRIDPRDGTGILKPTQFEGRVTLRGARIEGTLLVDWIEWDPDSELELNHAEVGCLSGVPATVEPQVGDAAGFDGWPSPGHLDLREFTYQALVFEGKFQQEALLRWLRLQTSEETPGTDVDLEPLKKADPERPEEKLTLPEKDASAPSAERDPNHPKESGPSPGGMDPKGTPSSEREKKGKDPTALATKGCSCSVKEPAPPPATLPADDGSLPQSAGHDPCSVPAVKAPPAPGNVALVLDLTWDDTKISVQASDEAWIDPRGFPAGSYHQLATVLEEMGRPDPAVWILEKKTRDMADHFWHEWNVFERAWSLLFWEISRSGYRPRRAGLAALVLAGIGTLLLLGGRRLGLIVPVKPAKRGEPRRPFYAFVYALDIAIPIIDFRQAKHWMPAPDPELEWWIAHPWLGRWAVRALWGWIWVSTAFGWFCATLFATGLLGLRG